MRAARRCIFRSIVAAKILLRKALPSFTCDDRAAYLFRVQMLTVHRLRYAQTLIQFWGGIIKSQNTTSDIFVLKRTITGLGLFTIRRIIKGKRIIEYVGPIINSEERDQKGGKYLFEIDENRAIDGSARSNIARYINHSCRPNAEAFTTGKRVWIWAKKNIEAGEEITIHYGREYVQEHIEPIGCKCKKCFVR